MSYYNDNYGSSESNNQNAGGYGNSYGRDFLMEEDPNLTPERRRIPALAQRVISRLYEVDPQSAVSAKLARPLASIYISDVEQGVGGITRQCYSASSLQRSARKDIVDPSSMRLSYIWKRGTWLGGCSGRGQFGFRLSSERGEGVQLPNVLDG